ncbi:MAG: DUF134 domain-containing protein [Candidatus Dojkabacteria bacterium]|nr:DUF134 domain-containing protein [Candidatus Dojkabacteria bacterium]
MRNRNRRKIDFNYNRVYYKPKGIPLNQLDEVELSEDELETIRLRYVENLSQIDAAKKMGISQSQYQRDLVNVLRKITKALIAGDAINIPAGNKL